MLDEIDVARRPTGWLPTQDSLLDSRRRAVQSAEVGDRRSTRRGGAHARHADAAGDLRPHAPLLRGPAILRDAQVAPRRLAVLAMVVVVAVAGLILGGRVLIARASVHPQAVVASPSDKKPTSAASGRTSPSFGAASPVSTPPVATVPRQVVVQVVGQVRRPGVVTLRGGARVQDAVAAAGGALPRADLAAVNLARVLTDGDQVQVPRPGQVMTSPVGSPGGAAGGTGGSGSTTGAAGTSGAAGVGVVNLNTADATALDALPGVGPVLAQRILDWRTRNGRFNSVDELGEVSGIGDKVLQRLRPRVSV